MKILSNFIYLAKTTIFELSLAFKWKVYKIYAEILLKGDSAGGDLSSLKGRNAVESVQIPSKIVKIS